MASAVFLPLAAFLLFSQKKHVESAFADFQAITDDKKQARVSIHGPSPQPR